MQGFDAQDRVGGGAHYTLWRRASLVGMEVRGLVDDAASLAWQRALTAEFDRAGWPRFFAMDISRVDPRNSLRSRLETAAFVRRTLQRLEFAALLTGGNAGATVVSRVILRVVGMDNIELVTDLALFERHVSAMLLSRRPAA